MLAFIWIISLEQTKMLYLSLKLTFASSFLLNPTLVLGFLRGIHGDSSKNTHPIPPPYPTKNDNGSSSNHQQDIDKLCKILSRNHYNSQQTISFNRHTTHSLLDDSGINLVTVELVEQVLKKLTSSGALALSFFRWAEPKQGFEHTTGIYNALIDSLGKIKQFQLIWDIVYSMKIRGILTNETFGLIERRYARARRSSDAIDTFEKMERYGLRQELSDLNCLLGTLCKSKNVRKAQEVFDEMVKRRKRFVADLKTYTVLLEGWGEEGKLVMLKEIYREMRAEGGFEPDVVTFGILVGAYCRCKKYNEALELLREIEANEKCKPSAHIYCTLISALGSGMRLDEALEIFERAKAVVSPLGIPTYNAVVGSYCWSMRLDDAYQAVEEMRRTGVGPNSRTYDIIIHHLIRLNRTEDAYLLFQRMASGDFGCEPNLNTYAMIVRMLCQEVERVDLAIKVWDQMRDKGILPCMYMFAALVNSLCHEYMMDDACRYFQEMLDFGIRPPGKLYDNLKEALLVNGMVDEAISIGEKLDKIRNFPWTG
ncbi:pentatricopeptide repeat-containing protein At1g71060, mitochondrial-like [Papaver somniferum]|uniref:pentatricopeptide repeat-containing protein At1g71060, mitochondrial-like n=1 Tax=Papaver somniferum TaxID=3469 RepID=UPI000E6F69B1|nr:pentatricopeptide repeat-containing protein At1g71060, mitochondrial-like [Papaver somniferum]